MRLKINKLKSNESNPRLIKDNKFKQLVQSIKDFPEMLELRPIVIDEDNIILGGNMRYRACIEAGLTELPVKIAEGLSEEQKKEFIVKDNLSFGEWDWDVLGNEWNNTALNDWGLDVWKTEDINFSPELNPTSSYDDITKEEIEKKAKELAIQMNKEHSQQSTICPKCLHEFKIQL
tara:strand:+ start:245 stop:772 length:528 start_codon:yes stop_codon:yes gene_type:complete